MGHTAEVLCFDPDGNKKLSCNAERPKIYEGQPNFCSRAILGYFLGIAAAGA
jgi:hypothetical protein